MTIISGINVPKDVIRLIFQDFDLASLRTSSKVCKVFREIALNENFLKSLFPDVVLPKGITIQQWLLQSIHNRRDLLKCMEHYLSLAAQDKPFCLRIITPLDAGLWISGTPTVSITSVWCNNDLFPVLKFAQKSETYWLNRGWLRSPCRISVTFMNTMGENSRLGDEIRSIIVKQFSPERVANNNNRLVTVIGGAVGVTALAVLGYCFSKNNE
jgi:hypothetical protein